MQELAYRIAKIVSKSAVFIVALFAFLGVLVVAVTQLEPFRKWAIDRGLTTVNEVLAGNLSVADVDGNLVTGLTLKEVQLDAGGTTLARIPRISLRYQLLPILESRTVGASLILHRPEILLSRNRSGVWNFTQIAAPDTDTLDEPRSPLEWIFDVSSLEIRDGEIRIQDLMEGAQPSDAGDDPTSTGGVDFLNTTLRQFNLEAGTYISEEKQSFDIRHLSFLESTSGIRLLELAGAIDVDSSAGTTIDNLRIETEGSLVELDLSVDTPGLFDSTFASDLFNSNFSLSLKGERVDADELKRLLPPLEFMSDTYGLELQAGGTLQSLTIDDLVLTASGTRLQLNGKLTDITDPDRFRIQSSVAQGSILRYRDLRRHLPGLDLTAVAYLEEVAIESIRFEGRPGDATASFEIETNVGDVVGGGYVAWEGAREKWRADVIGTDVDLGRIIPTEIGIDGLVNGRFVVEGSGFDPATMEARTRTRLGASTIAGRMIEHAWIEGGYGEGGIIVVDTALVAFGNVGGSSRLSSPEIEPLFADLIALRVGAERTDFTSRISLSERDLAAIEARPSARLAGWFDFSDPDLPRYRGVIESDRLDLSVLTLDPEQKTRLGLTVRIEGQGLELDNVEGIVQVDAYDIMLPNGEEILPFQIDSLIVEQSGTTRRVLLASDVADAEISGTWRFESLFPTLVEGFEKLADYVARKSNYRSEELAWVTDDDPVDIEPIAATYRFKPKDLSIVEAFMPESRLALDADLSGTISGTRSFLGLTIKGDIRRLLYAQGEDSYLVSAVALDADIRNISSGAMDDLLDAEISIRSDSVYTIAGTRISAPDLQLEFHNGRLTLVGGATIDDAYSVTVEGGVDVVAAQGYRLNLDSLTFGLANGQRWKNSAPIKLIVGGDGATIEQFDMFRSGAETISLTGRFDQFEQFEDVRLKVSSVPLAELRPFMDDAETLQMLETLGGRLDSIEVALGGTLESPEMDLSMLLENLVYTRVAIGSVQFDASYRDSNLVGEMRIVGAVNNPNDTVPVLADVTITRLPIDLAFASREERFLQNERIDITGRTMELPLGILGPFVPGILIQKGMTDLVFSVSGRFPDVDYSGTGRIKKGQILVESTNISYLVDARFDLREERLDLQGVSLRNLPSDYGPGKATAFGNITFDGFFPDQFNIGIRTDGLLVLSDATQAVNDRYYGDLVIATPPGKNLTFGGTYVEPVLKGDIIVLRSDLKYPYRDRVGELQNRVQFIDYNDRDSLPNFDVLKNGILPLEVRERLDSVRRANEGEADTNSTRQPKPERTTPEPDGFFMDRLLVNLTISIPKGIRLTIEIGLLNQLELIIDDGGNDKPLDFTMLGDDMQLSGEVRLLQGSEFTFIRTFQSTGTLEFEQNILNPKFAITGEYFGRRFQNGTAQQYTVEVTLGGTLEVPEISFDYTIAGAGSNDDEAQKQADALFLLLAGRRQSELFSSSTSQEDVATDALLSSTNALGTDVLGAALSGVFRDIGGLQTVEFDGSIDDPGGTTFRFVYAVDDVLVRYEGKISRFSDGTVTVELPLELLFNMSEFKNLSLQLQRDIVDEFGSSLAPRSSSGTTDNVFRVRLSLRYTF